MVKTPNIFKRVKRKTKAEKIKDQLKILQAFTITPEMKQKMIDGFFNNQSEIDAWKGLGNDKK